MGYIKRKVCIEDRINPKIIQAVKQISQDRTIISYPELIKMRTLDCENTELEKIQRNWCKRYLQFFRGEIGYCFYESRIPDSLEHCEEGHSRNEQKKFELEKHRYRNGNNFPNVAELLIF